MKKNLVIAIAIVALVAGAIFGAQAIAGHNSKSAFAGSETLISTGDREVAGNVLLGDAIVKVSQKTDLVISLTAVSSLFTDTAVKGNIDGSLVQESSTAGITVWANVTPLDNSGNPAGDPAMAYPEKVVLNKRIQTLSGKLSNVIINCVADNGTIPEDCVIDEAEEIELKLDTTSANGFNFLALNLDQGHYLVEVFAELETDLTPDDSKTTKPIAAIGKRTIVVWEVKNPDMV